jgi:hypothetical protein
MRNRSPSSSILSLFAAIGFTACLVAQNAMPQKTATATAASARDFTGVWEGQMSNGLTTKGAEAPLTSWGQAQSTTRRHTPSPGPRSAYSS